MPLHIPVYLNDREIEVVHIGRTGPIDPAEDFYHYIVTTHEYPQTMYEGKPRRYTPNWDVGVPFTHKYSDGALKCLSRALEALEGIEKAGST